MRPDNPELTCYTLSTVIPLNSEQYALYQREYCSESDVEAFSARIVDSVSSACSKLRSILDLNGVKEKDWFKVKPEGSLHGIGAGGWPPAMVGYFRMQVVFFTDADAELML